MLSPVSWVKDTVREYWDSYIALVDVAEENKRLKKEIKVADRLITLATEEKAELTRLRQLLSLDVVQEVPSFGARVIAMRFGPLAALKTLTVNKGFVDGVIIGTPVVAPAGVVGRVHRTAPHAATVLLLTDPGFRLAVISQESRTPGILRGSPGTARDMEVTYVAQTAHIAEGELLITAGVDGGFPKGIPVGIVTRVEPGHETLFQQVQAKPMVELEHLEEVLLLQPEGSGPPLMEKLPDPVAPDILLFPQDQPAQPGAPGNAPDVRPQRPAQGQPPARANRERPAAQTSPPPRSTPAEPARGQ